MENELSPEDQHILNQICYKLYGNQHEWRKMLAALGSIALVEAALVAKTKEVREMKKGN